MLSFLRTQTPRTPTAHLNPVVDEGGRHSRHYCSPSHPYVASNVIPATTAAHGRSINTPPLHLHMYQTEDFLIHSGVARFSIDGEKILAKQGDKIHIPMGAFHTFENASEDGEDLVISVRLDKADFPRTESFFRNFSGYLEDCQKAGQEPSIFQLCRLLWEIQCPVVLPGLGKRSTFVGRHISWFFMLVAGVVIGEWLLGYKGTYPEYYLSDKEKEKVM